MEGSVGEKEFICDAGFDREPVKTDDGGMKCWQLGLVRVRTQAAGLGAGENPGSEQVRTLPWCR